MKITAKLVFCIGGILLGLSDVSCRRNIYAMSLISDAVFTFALQIPTAFAGGVFQGRSKQEDVDGSKTVNNQIIDEILRKAEIAKAKKKEQDLLNAASQSDRNGELDPIKCFPKALCGVSSEVEQISKRKKNGLISEYLILMKAVARHPEFLSEAVPNKDKDAKGKKKKEGSDAQDDLSSDNDGSDSEEDDYSDEEEEDEDEEEDDEPTTASKKSVKKWGKKKKEETPPKTEDEFHKAYLKEKLAMNKLMKETMHKEGKEMEQQSWDSDAGLPGLSSQWNRPYGSSNRPPPPPPSRPWGFGGLGSRPGPSSSGHRPYFRGDKSSEQQDTSSAFEALQGGISSGIAGISSFFKNLFGFGDSSLTNDPWFPAAARDLAGEVAPGIAVDETREILETALEVGKSFEKPSQCNEVFNACPYEYTELLYIIDDLRKIVRASVKDKTQTDGSKKKEKAKSELSTKNSPKKSERVKKKANKYSSGVDETSGEDPERYVIPVTPPPSPTLADTFSNVLSWLGLSSSN